MIKSKLCHLRDIYYHFVGYDQKLEKISLKNEN